jgi:hypothetical protein
MAALSQPAFKEAARPCPRRSRGWLCIRCSLRQQYHWTNSSYGGWPVLCGNNHLGRILYVSSPLFAAHCKILEAARSPRRQAKRPQTPPSTHWLSLSETHSNMDLAPVTRISKARNSHLRRFFQHRRTRHPLHLPACVNFQVKCDWQ